MSAKKVLTLVLCMVLVAALSVAGTLAYLTSQDSVENTFSMGHVEIELNETAVGEDGKAILNTTSKKNAYHLIPGFTYDKDPTVTVKQPSDNCYVRMMVTVTVNNLSAVTEPMMNQNLTGIFTGHDENVWNRVNKTVDSSKNAITYEYRYVKDGGIVNAVNGPVTLPALFTQVKVPSTWDNAQMDQLEGLKINVTAHAIQADGFANADAAWAAFNAQP